MKILSTVFSTGSVFYAKNWYPSNNPSHGCRPPSLRNDQTVPNEFRCCHVHSLPQRRCLGYSDLWNSTPETRALPLCQIEYVSSDSDVGTPCGKTAVARCSDCGSSICADCRVACCGTSFCEFCYDYDVTHSCVRKPVQNEPYPFRLSFGSSPDKAA
jgi:hypothetical protein